MRKLYFAIVAFAFIISACSKSINGKATRNAINEPPVIKIISANNTQPLKAYDQLMIKAKMTDIDMVAVASWEAVNASVACGNSSYKGSYTPMTQEYELDLSFTIPASYSGEHVIKLYGVDGAGNIATLDVPYKSDN
jgi:hypothetical protein